VDVLAYVVDTNVIADFLRGVPNVVHHVSLTVDEGHVVGLCPPVHYEVVRGLLRKDSRGQLVKYQREVAPMLSWAPALRDDWDRAAQLWAEARTKGRQLSDMDLLIAAMAIRLDAILVTADDDFSALPVRRENWRG
jgi:predicted nucleic acid-binding protein